MRSARWGSKRISVKNKGRRPGLSAPPFWRKPRRTKDAAQFYQGSSMAEEKKIITIVTKYAGQGADLAKKALNELISLGGRTGAALSSAFSSMGKTALSALGAQKDFFGEVWTFAKESIQLAAENARAVSALQDAYQQAGYTASGAMTQAQGFAAEMQRLTGLSDETFLNAQRQLADFGVVGGQAQEAVRAAFALSAEQGISFESALQQLIRTAAGAVSALSDYGIVLDGSVKEGEEFQAVLDKINVQFGGSAQAAMGDSIAKVGALKESWANLKEQIGAGLAEGLIPMVDYLAIGVQWLQKLFVAGSNTFDFLFGLIQTGLTGLATGIVGVAGAAVKSVGQIVSIGEKLYLVPKGVADAVRGANEFLTQTSKELSSQTATFGKMTRSVKDIWPVEKKLTEEQQKQLDLSAQVINAKRKIKSETAGIAAADKQTAAGPSCQPEAVTPDSGGGKQDTVSDGEINLAGGSREDSLSAGDIWSGKTSQFSGLQDVDLLEEQLTAQRDKKLEYLQAELGDTQEYETAKEELLAQTNEKLAQLNQQRAKQNQQIMGDIFNNLISLSSSSNKKLAAIGKAAAIAQATISTYQGAANALGSVPWPLNFAAAASVVAAGLVQVANIAGVELANGGLVKAVTGGIPAIIGEGGSDEAVLPLDNARAMRRIGGAIAEESGSPMGEPVTVNVNVNATGGLTPFLEEMTLATQNGVTEALRLANVMVRAGNAQSGMSV